MSFRDDFIHTPAGPTREQLVYQAIVNEGKPNNLVPITVNGSDNTKITYYVTPDFLNVDGVWTPMTGTTAQMIADYFHMHLPTPKMSRQIYEAATTKVMPPPLSGTGYGQYSAQQVVQSRIGASDAAIEYSNRIAKALQNKGKGLSAGYMKDITQPPPSGNLGLYGWYGNDGKPIQNSYFTPHGTNDHTEYGSGVRLVDDRVDIIFPNGKKEAVSMGDFMSSNLSSALADGTKGIARYDVNKDKANLASITPTKENQEVANKMVDNTNTGRLALIQRIDQFFSNLEKEV